MQSHRPENEAEHRFAVIKPLASRFRNSATSIEEAAKLLSISPRQVYRLIEVCRSSPYLDAFERQSNSPKGASNSRLPVVVENIISKCIEAVFDGREEKQSADDVYAQVFTKCVEVGEQPPSLRTIRRRVGVFLSKNGHAHTRSSRKSKTKGGRLIVTRPLSWVQVDHTMMDEMVDLREFGLGVRRPWLTLAIDVATRLVYGYYIGISRPTTRSLMFAILQGALPKRAWLEDRGHRWEEFQEHNVDNIWPIEGMAELYSFDNDKTFKNRLVSYAATYLGFRAHYRPVGTPRYGGHIERLIGTFMGRMKFLPGTTFSNVVEKGDYDSAGKALLTLDELEYYFLYEVARYHLSTHRMLSCSPLQKFAELKHKIPRSALETPDPFRLQLAFLPREYRTVRHDGVRLRDRTYFSPSLSTLQGQRVAVIYRPWDMSSVSLSLDGKCEHLKLTLVPDGFNSRHHDVWFLAHRRPDLVAESKRQNEIALKLRTRQIEWLDKLRSSRVPLRRDSGPRQIGKIIHDDALLGDADWSKVVPFTRRRLDYE